MTDTLVGEPADEPREERRALVRDLPFEMRAQATDDGLTMSGYAAVFGSITRIDSWEGRFDEQLSRGAFAQGIRSGKTPVLMFDHGKHPQIGPMPIGKITEMREDSKGLWVEARLFNNDLVKPVRDAIDGEAITGMSFRFSVPKGKETWDRSTDVPLRTIHEVNCAELGPVVFPAYTDTTVGVRSISDIPDDVIEALRERILGTSTEEAATPTPEQLAREHSGSTIGERDRVLRDLSLKGLL